jgi:hypothetical protein
LLAKVWKCLTDFELAINETKGVPAALDASATVMPTLMGPMPSTVSFEESVSFSVLTDPLDSGIEQGRVARRS